MLRLEHKKRHFVSCHFCPIFSCFYCKHVKVCRFAFFKHPSECEYFECSLLACKRRLIEDVILLAFDRRSYDIMITTLKCASYGVHYFVNPFDKRMLIRAVYASDVHAKELLNLLRCCSIVLIDDPGRLI